MIYFNRTIKRFLKLSLMAGILCLSSCATYKESYGTQTQKLFSDNEKKSEILHEFYLVGDAGNSEEPQSQNVLRSLEKRLNNAEKNSSLIILGDNIYPKGMPVKVIEERKKAEQKLDYQLSITRNYKGSTYVIPGNHDWYHGLDGLAAQKEYVNKYLNTKNAFYPKKNNPIDKVNLNDDLTLVFIDSEWFIQNWNRHPNINALSTYKTREDFFEEFRSLINKNQNKTILVFIHHPLVSNGPHGGYFSLRSHLFPAYNIPAPVFGTLINYLRKTSGGSPADIQNSYYSQLVNRLKALTQTNENVVYVSGHEHNLQYIEKDGIKQIISGSASKNEEARAIQPVSFSSGKSGYSILRAYKDGSLQVAYYGVEEKEDQLLFSHEVLPAPQKEIYTIPENKSKTIKASIYPEKVTQKSKLYKFLFGDHYRELYGLAIEANSVNLDTLYGGLTPTISGGGNQSMSLRLKNPDGKEFVMRGLKKSATQFLQTALFKDQRVKESFEDTFAETFINDFYTTSNPYTPFIVGNLSDNLTIKRTNPILFYVPKQNALGKYNALYGDALYMIEERPSDSQLDADNFGNPDAIISTDDVIKNLMKDEKYEVDADEFLKVRIFDMLIGDWDRHADQWRWSEYRKDGKIIYQPIPRDRDQVFAKIDGALLSLIKKLPPLRHMQSFKKEFPNPRWMNKSAFPLDVKFLQEKSLEEWQNMAQQVVDGISDENIERSFALLPKEIPAKTNEEIKEILKIRRSKLVAYVGDFYKELSKTIILTGTDKKDTFLIDKNDDNTVKVTYIRSKKNGDEVQSVNTYDAKNTRELWIYGLDDNDHFIVKGKNNAIKIRLIGGPNNDIYDLNNTKNVKVYDYASKNNTYTDARKSNLFLSNMYNVNQYDYRKVPLNILSVLPNAGYNPDNGLKIGFNATYTVNNFVQNPYSQKHHLKGNFAFATNGIELGYEGAFKNATNNWMFTIKADLTDSNFTQNFFGIGNETVNNDKVLGKNHNRVRMETYKVEPGYKYEGRNGGSFEISGGAESIKIEDTQHREIDTAYAHNENLYEAQQFGFGKLHYTFKNYNNKSYPTLGFGFDFEYGFKANLKEANVNHNYIDSRLNFVVPLNQKESFAFSSTLLSKIIMGNTYEFYQGAAIGGAKSLRGFREQRFIGKQSFVHSSDIRWHIGDIRQGIVPMKYGMLAGFDYGKVWAVENSNKWHNSYGAGIWLSAIETLTFNLNYFRSSEDDIITFGLGFGF